MELQEWNSGTRYEFMLYKLILWPLGIWSLNKGEIFSEIRLIFSATTQIATFTCLSLEMWKNCRGLGDILDLFVLSIFSMLACIKGLIVRYHQNDLYSNITSAIANWCSVAMEENDEKRNTMLRHARVSRLVYFSLMIPASGGTLSWIIFALPLPMFQPENSTEPLRNFPLQTACTFEAIAHSNIYYIVFILQIYQLITTCLGNCGNDVFFFALGHHLCGQLEILNNEFEKLITLDKLQSKKNIQNYVNRHLHLIGLVEKLENAYNLIILAQLIMSALLICIMGLQMIIALKMSDLYNCIKASIVLSSLMSQLFLYSYGGDCLTSKNLRLASGVYNSLWYKSSPTIMKDVNFIIMCSNKPIYVTAGKFFAMTLGSFMEILKASASYMSVLRVAMDV